MCSGELSDTMRDRCRQTLFVTYVPTLTPSTYLLSRSRGPVSLNRDHRLQMITALVMSEPGASGRKNTMSSSAISRSFLQTRAQTKRARLSEELKSRLAPVFPWVILSGGLVYQVKLHLADLLGSNTESSRTQTRKPSAGWAAEYGSRYLVKSPSKDLRPINVLPALQNGLFFVGFRFFVWFNTWRNGKGFHFFYCP